MAKMVHASKFLPLSEATYFIMLACIAPMHGYGVMQKVEEISNGAITIGPGTLYGAFSTLEKEGLLEMVREVGRRKEYQLTSFGRDIFRAQLERLQLMVSLGDAALKNEEGSV